MSEGFVGTLQHIELTPLVPLRRTGQDSPVGVLVRREHLNSRGSLENCIGKAIVGDAEARSVKFDDGRKVPKAMARAAA